MSSLISSNGTIFAQSTTPFPLNDSHVYNGTTGPLASKDRPTWYWVIRALFAFVTVFGNGLVIYIISSRRRLRSQPSPNWFILSLAVADFFVGAFNAPAFFIYSFYVKDDQNTWIGLQFFMNIFLIASTTNICVLTLDRYIAVIHPFKHTNFAKASTSAIAIAVAWILPVLQRIPYLVFKITDANDKQFGYQIFYIFGFIFLPNLFLLFAYIRIIFVAKEHRKQIRALTSHCESSTGVSMDSTSTMSANSSSRREQKKRLHNSYNGTIAVGIVVFIFLVCNSFLCYWLMCYYLFPKCKETESSKLFISMVLLRYVNSAPNFFVYSLIKSDFQREVKRMLKRQ